MTLVINNILNANKSVVVANANTGAIVVAGSSAVSNLTSYSAEVVVNASISKVIYSAMANGHWVVKRGSNTVGVYSGTGSIDYTALGALLSIDSAANVSANLVNSADGGSIVIELKKNV
jgi:hypothetical protein